MLCFPLQSVWEGLQQSLIQYVRSRLSDETACTAAEQVQLMLGALFSSIIRSLQCLVLCHA